MTIKERYMENLKMGRKPHWVFFNSALLWGFTTPEGCEVFYVQEVCHEGRLVGVLLVARTPHFTLTEMAVPRQMTAYKQFIEEQLK